MVEVQIEEKTIGSKQLFKNLSLRFSDGEKLAVIGRNGVGKSTLFAMIAARDNEYIGKITKPSGLRVALTDQEHLPTSQDNETVLQYLLRTNQSYQQLNQTIEQYTTDSATDMASIESYSQAIELFHQYGFDQIENSLVTALEKYQIPEQLARGPLAALSGGQKRFVQLVQIEFSHADFLLIDEPTNHMDYVAKESFIAWLKESKGPTIVIITHDRDVLAGVERIVELKDKHALSYRGNYEAYLRQNSTNTTNQMSQYEIAQRRIAKLKQQIAYARSKKAGWSGTADKKNPFVVMEVRLTKELKELEKTVKPSFWIDQESVQDMSPKAGARYDKYKDRNINISLDQDAVSTTELVRVEDLSLGFDKPLFENITFRLQTGEKIQIHGRNGAGKSTLVSCIRSTWRQEKPASRIYAGLITIHPSLRIGYYEQEIGAEYIEMPLIDAVMQAYRNVDRSITHSRAMQILAEYLFDPPVDGNIPLRRLSGGQRARFQLIRMLAHDPNLLILDEPTNHLDLPSIEELENALLDYSGAILYVSHDSYFAKNIGGEVVQIGLS